MFVDTSGFDRKMKRLREAGKTGQTTAMMSLGKLQIDAMIYVSPRDTLRYVRAWAMAGNGTKLGHWIVQDVQPSRHIEKLKDRLEGQRARYKWMLDRAKERLDYWARLYDNRYLNTGRKDRWARDAYNQVRKYEARVQRVQELYYIANEALNQLRYDPSAIVIWGRGATKSALGRSKLATVRDQVYGGEGKLQWVGDRLLMTLHNREPHASIVEKNHRVVARALAAVRVAGLRRASRAFKGSVQKVR